MKKRIKDFEEYFISTNGVVYSEKSNKELKQFYRKGYLSVSLRNCKIKKTFSVHRLVALAFIPNPDNKPQIDHIDGDKENNKVENLRWATYFENNNNAVTKQRQIKNARKPMLGKFGKENHLSKAVIMKRNGVFIKEYQSINLATKDGFNSSLIVRCCKGLRKKHKCYEWEYKG